jgi:hypothetical protein
MVIHESHDAAIYDRRQEDLRVSQSDPAEDPQPDRLDVNYRAIGSTY